MRRSDAAYWSDPCPRCRHGRAWHGEGGCNSESGGVLGGFAGPLKRCGCRVGQGAIPGRTRTGRSPK